VLQSSTQFTMDALKLRSEQRRWADSIKNASVHRHRWDHQRERNRGILIVPHPF